MGTSYAAGYVSVAAGPQPLSAAERHRGGAARPPRTAAPSVSANIVGAGNPGRGGP